MRKLIFVASIFFLQLGMLYTSANGWGRTGHFITGEIAGLYLTDEAKDAVDRILGETSLTVSTVWMDEVRSRDEYSYTRDWHWVTIPDGMTYEESEKNPNGDVVEAIDRLVSKLKSGNLSEKDERDFLRMVIHMIGDMHQPLHVGRGDDRGGNDVRVQWMGRNSNLHRVWDTNMIESYGLTTQQWTEALNIITPETVQKWQSGTVQDWAHESMQYRDAIYDLPESMELGWEYRNKNFHVVEKRLLQAGVRIAYVLNKIYG
ncbi:MAG: S1/P1 nuclease [Balneolales bacterium]|nr:S1/P1 nuclease [Balneolales bacterium]